MGNEPIRAEGKTVEEARAKALHELGLPPDKAEFTIVQEPAWNILGIQSKNAVVVAKAKERQEEPASIEERVEAAADLPQKVGLHSGDLRFAYPDSSESATVIPGDKVTLVVNGKECSEPTPVCPQDEVQLITATESGEGKYSLIVAEDELTATLRLIPAKLTAWKLKDQLPQVELKLKTESEVTYKPPAVAEEIFREMSRLQVIHGVDKAAVVTACQDIPPEGRDVVIARGDPPTPGKEASVKYDFPESLKLQRGFDEADFIDHKHRFIFNSVEPGDNLAVISPPEPGRPGTSVTGKPIPPPPVPELIFVAGAGVEISEDSLRAKSTAYGRPYTHKRGPEIHLRVEPVLDINGDVDLATSSIDFQGNVNIAGDIVDTMEVKATGSVQIGGSVFHARVLTGDSIALTGNAISARLTAGGSLLLAIRMRPILRDLNENLALFRKASLQVIEQLPKVPANIAPMVNMLLQEKFQVIVELKDKLKDLHPPVEEEFVISTVTELVRELGSWTRPYLPHKDWFRSWEQIAASNEKLTAWSQGKNFQPVHLSVGYAANSHLQSAGSVTINKGCHNTIILAGQEVTINGYFRGGKIEGGGNVTVHELGSDGGAPTSIATKLGATVQLDRVWDNCQVQVGPNRYHFDKPQGKVNLPLFEHSSGPPNLPDEPRHDH